MSEGLACLLNALQPAAEDLVDIEAIRLAGWEAGFAAGTADAAGGLVVWRDRMTAAALGLETACVVDVDRLRPVVMALVRQVAAAVMAAEYSKDNKLLSALAGAALDAVGPGTVAVLRAHPATLAGLAPLAVATEADAGMGLDEIVVSGAEFVIDVRLAARLAEIMGEMS